MNDESTKQTQEDKPEEAKKYGKFDSLEGLLKAYTALEAEFTKRCQRLKELEQALSAQDRNADREQQSAEQQEQAHQQAQEQTAPAQAGADSRQLLECVVLNPEMFNLLVSDRRVKDAVISDYLNSLNGAPARTLSAQIGYPVMTPVKKPKTLAEAKRIAEMVLSR